MPFLADLHAIHPDILIPMSTLETQIERWQKAEIPREQLLRDVVGHDNWTFFVGLGGVDKLMREGGVPGYNLQHDEHGQASLLLFSSAEPMKTYVQASGITEWHCEMMAAAGRDVFSTLPDDIRSVTLNPLTPLTVSCGDEQLKVLRHLALAAYIEADLKALSDGSIQNEAEFNRVVSGFALRELLSGVSSGPRRQVDLPAIHGGQRRSTLGRGFHGARQRHFLLNDCAAELPGRYRIERVTGASLAEIALALQSPGILFNWRGYVAPQMLNAQFLQIVISSQPGG